MFYPPIHSILPPDSGSVILEYTLPSLLDQVCDRHPNPRALHQCINNRWQPMSNDAFRLASEEFALGLLQLEFVKGDRVCFFLNSDIHFAIADMTCLMAGLVDVPVDLGFDVASIQFILQQTEAKGLVVANLDLLRQIVPHLERSPQLQIVVVAEVPNDWLEKVPKLPRRVQVMSLDSVRARGRVQWSEAARQHLRDSIAPEDLATIVYTASPTTEQPRGVMLTHASLAGNILAAFSNFAELSPGKPEVALLFLPLSHIFARAFLYGHLYYSHPIYFSSPNRVNRHLRDVQPTIFITVPRLLEKAYEKAQETGQQLPRLQRTLFHWALNLAQRYELGKKPKGWYAVRLKLADRLVFRQWRSQFGGRIKYLICGGAALRPEIATVFTAAGIPILQGYGLTESGSVLSCNRGKFNQAGTVGAPIAGVEMALAADGEILAKTPYGMLGYYKDPAMTARTIDPEGWLHTGDVGEITATGLVKITGYKKNLFKLSTGKYVAPQPIEAQLRRSPLVKQVIVTGAQQKFCTLLIFPDLEYVCNHADGICAEVRLDMLLKHPKITGLYQALVDEVNQKLPHWSTIKRFRLMHLMLTAEEGIHAPAFILKRDSVNQLFTSEITAMYTETEPVKPAISASAEAVSSVASTVSEAPLNDVHASERSTTKSLRLPRWLRLGFPLLRKVSG